MPKTLVFYNQSWTRGQKPLRFSDCIDMPLDKLLSIFHTTQYCTNSETYLMTDCLLKIFDAQWVDQFDFETMRAANADSIVVNGLHCLSGKGGFDRKYWQNILDLGIKVVPMPLGFWYQDGIDYMTSDMKYIIAQIAERNEIGVRGAFAADILMKAGIKNVRVVGDVSLLYHGNRQWKVNPAPEIVHSLNCDFTNFYPYQFHTQAYFQRWIFPIFHYFVKLWREENIHVDYTCVQSPMEEILNHTSLESYDSVRAFLCETGRFFFSVPEWIEALKKNDFMLGTRFHGGVASILAGTPVLMVALDRRMQELMDVSRIPYILPEEFDPEKSIEYYADKCDFDAFNKHYPLWFDNYVDYCVKNDVALNVPAAERSVG